MFDLSFGETYEVQLSFAEVNLIVDALLQMERFLSDVIGCENESMRHVADHREALALLAQRLDEIISDGMPDGPVN